MTLHMGINPEHFREYIIQPSLRRIDMYSLAAEELLLGTAAQESYLGYYLHQVGGPALGIYQIEPSTHEDLWVNYIEHRQDLYELLIHICPLCKISINDELLITDLAYATIIARLIYYRKPEQLPSSGDIRGQAAYWKTHYNTLIGKGTQSGYIANAKKVGLS